MSLAAWIMLAAHIAILIFIRKKVKKRERQLSAENGNLVVENERLQGKLMYYKRQLKEQNGGQ